MADRAGVTPFPRLSARIKGGVATFKAEGTWGRGQVYAAIKRWRGADAELAHRRRAHTLILTLGGATALTGSRISGAPVYEGRDLAGCITFVPSQAERLGWYRDADMTFLVLLVDPEFVRSTDFGHGADELRGFTNRRDPLVETVLSSLAREMRGGSATVPSLYAEHAAGLLMSHLMRSNARSTRRTSFGAGLPAEQLRLVLDFVEENLHRDLSLADLGVLVGLVPDVFARKFRHSVGIPPYRYLIERRIRRAELLLAERDRSIAEIALAVGFSSQSHFTTQFGKFLNMTPAAYRGRRH